MRKLAESSARRRAIRRVNHLTFLCKAEPICPILVERSPGKAQSNQYRTITSADFNERDAPMKWTTLRLLALALASSAAHAQTTTLDYQSTAFNGFTETLFPSGLVNFESGNFGPISADVVLSNPLDPNENNQVVTPVAWNFDAVPGPFPLDSQFFASNTMGSGQSTLFSFSTQSGQITSWDVELSFGPQGGTNTTGVETFDTFGPATGHGLNGQDLFAFNIGGPDGSEIAQAASIGGATWSQAVQAPEFDPSTTFSALTLLVGCLAVFTGRRRSV